LSLSPAMGADPTKDRLRTREGLPAAPEGRTGWPWDAPHSLPGSPHPGTTLPRVSIVVPSFNQGRFIEETIRSILLQGYPDLELLVIDGGSRDETVEILQRYDAHIDYWVSEPDRGQTHAINKGLERATGEIFTYLNSDDLLHPGAIDRVVETFLREPEVAVVHGECLYVDEEGRERYRQRGRVDGFVDYLRIWERFSASDYITQPEAFCRRDAIVAVGGFREELQSVMDFEMWLRLLARGYRFRAIDAPVAHFRTYASQKSSVDPGHELCRVVEEYVGSAEAALDATTRRRLLGELARARSGLLVRAAMAANILGNYPRAVRFCLSAAAGRPSVVTTYGFWSVLLHPLKRAIPGRGRDAFRALRGGSR
jgi:glycosyltransferase involved in cell wall biosynthesis